MGTHLYVCNSGGPITLEVEGTPPKWATCPVCAQALECPRCDGAELQGDAPPFTAATRLVYRCAEGHERVIRLPEGAGTPESAHCPECEGMLLPVESAAPAIQAG